ncbi:MAG: hypothetical protein JWL61_3936 [Gemmatimonadetes bacterium]|nr:hypothetical protein [Gemmatimonadota bacterium]
MGVIAGFGGSGVNATYFFDVVGSPPMVQLDAVVLRRASTSDASAPDWATSEGWDFSSGTEADAIRYSSTRRLISVAGVEYHVPAGEQTYVLMIDDVTPSVTIRMIDVLQQAHYEIDPLEAERARADPTRRLRKAIAARMSESISDAHRAWDATLKADPVVHQFLTSR